MRIAISNSMRIWGGGENWSLSVAEGMATRGHEVFLVCDPHGELYRRATESHGCVSVVPLTLRGDINPGAILRMRSFFLRERIQITVCNMDREVRSLGIAARLSGNITFIRRRGSDYAFKNRLRFRLTYAHLVDRVLINSEATRRTILEQNQWMPRNKLYRIYNGVPVEQFFPSRDLRESTRRDLSYGDDCLVLGMSGALLPRKKHMVLLKAVSLLLERIPSIRLLIIGPYRDKEYLSELRRVIEDLGLSGIADLHGPVSSINKYYNAMDILVMPSENEGFGYAAAEAMAAGVATVVSDASSLPEVVGDSGNSGVIFPVNDYNALSHELLSLWESPGKRKRIAEAGRNRIVERFSLDRMLEDTEEFFASLLQ
jgi:glycosyltransferase involved in cell wall biosynthesis